jgi:hypothetical protein
LHHRLQFFATSHEAFATKVIIEASNLVNDANALKEKYGVHCSGELKVPYG